ncbi:hypothetical protein HNQ80_002485 [Anaerosolibacter carboniphilus]|uniref:Uncharacterized protein n=1 Tax=Anaerosolibacter carboniphilus TaxID=1417629 RepID=A0A841L1Z7_9FIRM|nr:hypothetical protein [Anaerosolibacter carboniphilus]MBB6216385.1 hypothetical protein [Anaerosolibacter carboniphilus]
MKDRKFEVIKGKKGADYELTHRFIEAYATNTRLMGVVGLIIKWETELGETFHQFFHLDAEEFGLDDYISILSGSEESVEMTAANMMGGLGGKTVALREKEAVYLIQQFIEKSKQFNEELPEPIHEYEYAMDAKPQLDEVEITDLWDKICEPVISPIQLVNYFVMRAAAFDEEGMRFLSEGQGISYKIVKKPATLLKNIIEPVDGQNQSAYMAESLIDLEQGYKMVVSEIKTEETEKGWRVKAAEVKTSMNITGMEAAFSLSKDEYITVYHVKNFREFMRKIDKEKPHAMKHGYEVGILYTEFNPTNEHVKNTSYYLNDDIYGVYYITESSQLLVCAYSQKQIRELEKYFGSSSYEGILELEEKFHLDRSVLYEFVHSGFDSFYEFLEED